MFLGATGWPYPILGPVCFGGLFHKCIENTQNINFPWHTTMTHSLPHYSSCLHWTLRRLEFDKENRTPEDASISLSQRETELVTAWNCFQGKWQRVALYSKGQFLQDEQWDLLTVRGIVRPGSRGGPARAWHACYPTLCHTPLFPVWANQSHTVITNESNTHGQKCSSKLGHFKGLVAFFFFPLF